MPERVLIIKMYVSFSQLALFLLLAALMPGLEGRQLFSSVQPGIEARLHASFSSFDGLEWEIQSPSQPLMSLYVESFTVDSKLIKPPVVPGLVAYDGPCSQKDQILLENSRIFSATRGATCLSIPATKNKKRASNLFLSVMVLAAALMPGLEGRRLFSSVQPGIEARLHASFSSFDGLEWEIRSPSQPLMSLYVDLFIVDNKLIKPPVVPGLVAYDGPCSQKDQILPENSRIFSATRGATCLSIPATKNKKRASNLYLSVMVLAAALMPGLEGRRLFSSVQPGIEARLHASFSSFDGLEWEIQSPSQPLMSLYVESFTVDSKLIKPPVVPGLVAYDGPCSQKNHKLPENTRIIYATRGATCLSIPATKNKKRASNLFLSVMVLAAALMPGLEGRRLFSSVQPGIEARLNASFSSFDGLEWEIRSPSQSLLSLYVERFIVDNKLTKPPVVPGLVAYDGPCSQKDQKLPENTRIFLATRGVMCLSLPATINKKRARNLFLSVMALGERRMDESFTEQNQIEPNIVGGRPISSIRRWPWMVSLQYLADHICGGVIIGRRWVVTAAHCLRNSFKPYPNLSVKAGTVDLYSNTATQIAVEKVIIHPGNFLQHYDDIALLKLKEPLRMSDTIQAIKLPQYDQKSYKRCFLTGWGKTSTYSYLSRYLKDIEMFIKKDSECNKRETILCADGEGSGCYGDSGGPLMCRDNEASSWKLVGILSHGQGCSKNAFTKVYSYLDWIHDTINLETSSDNDCSPENPGSCSPQRNIENAFPFSYKSSNDDLETGLSNTDSIMCSGHTTIDVTQPGTISSPGFQSYTPYPTNLDCQLNLKIPKNKVLSVQFFDFYLDGSKNCRFDRLEISESKNGRDYSVSKTLCGARRPDFLVIKGPNIKFRFVTSKLNFEAFTGFKLAYHIATEQGENKRIEQSCPKQLIIDGQSSGSITSPGFERGEYPPNQKCEYILRFPIEGRLKINFDVFSLEDECDYDAVTIFDPRNQYEIARFCGNNIPKDMILRGPAIGIRFESDEYAQFRGFRLFYSFHMIECGMRKSWNEQDSTRPTIKPESNVFSALKWPWMVSIQHPEGHYCGGSIIDEQWVLSSAKCFRNNSRKYSDFRVKAGAVDLDSTDATVVPVETITMYPGYRLKNPFDIALVKLKEPLKMSDSIQRICLPKQDRKSYKRCFSLGWPVKFPNQPRRPILTELELFIRKKEDYAKIIDYGWNFINDESCIKGDEIGCRVNTTGPLVCYNEASSKWRVVGIQTFRPGACDTTQQMLTKVFSYVDWIYDTMLGDSRKENDHFVKP